MDNTQAGGSQGGKPTLSWQSGGSSGKPPVAQNDKPKSPAPPVTPKKPDEKSSMSGYVGIFIAGLVVGLLLGWGIVSSRMGGSTTSTSTSTTQTTSTGSNSSTSGSSIDLSGAMAGGLGGLSIDSPQTAGFNVAVSKIDVAAPTWVVVYESQGGTPGKALGAELFFPASQGGLTSGTIELLRGTLPGQTYLIGESVDDGDHIFSTANDKPVRDDKGNPLFLNLTTK